MSKEKPVMARVQPPSMKEINWENYKEIIGIKIDHITMEFPGDGTLVSECERCGYLTPHQLTKTHGTYAMADVVISEMKRFAVLYERELSEEYKDRLRDKRIRDMTPLEKVMLELAREGVRTWESRK